MNPAGWIWVLQNLQGQFSGTHPLRSSVKLFKEVAFLQQLGEMSYIYGLINEAASLP